MDAFVVHPDEGGPFPSVFILMDIWGLREELFDVARRVAVTGYHCILPNFWYRRGKVRFEFRNEKGQMRSLLDLPQKVQDEIHDNMNLVTDPMAMADIRSALNYLDSEPVRQGPKGSIGYLSRRPAGAALPPDTFRSEFRATASLHGTRLVNETPESPHLLRGQIQGLDLLRLCREGSLGAAGDDRGDGQADEGPRQRALPRPSCIPARCTAIRCPTATSSTSRAPTATGRTSSRCSGSELN